jgi:hypothetical protein
VSARTKAKRRASRTRFVERVAMWPGRCGRRRTLCRECKGPLGYCVHPCPCAPLRAEEPGVQLLVRDGCVVTVQTSAGAVARLHDAMEVA